MKTRTNGLTASAGKYHESVNFDLTINPVMNNNSYALQAAPEVLKETHARFPTALANEVRNPLTSIQLSVGMLEALSIGNDSKIYLDIILRSSMRINDLINELLKYQQADKVRAKYIR
jgi:signal transduction histidine kinase